MPSRKPKITAQSTTYRITDLLTKVQPRCTGGAMQQAPPDPSRCRRGRCRSLRSL